MARKKFTSIRFRVEGHSPFPIDMLRYDYAHPNSEGDSAVISNSHTREYPLQRGPYVVDIVAYANAAPNARRYESFGWRVTQVWNGYDWEGYQGQRVIK